MTIELPIVPKNGISILNLDMTRIYRAENRVDEIAIANEHKAPELMAFFNRAYSDATNYSNTVAAEVVRAQKVAEYRKSVVILDEVPKVLKARGLVSESSTKVAGTVAQQEAILTQDIEYQAAVDLVDGLKHYKDLMDRKMDIIEKAYLGVRKILGGDRMSWLPNKNLGSGPVNESVPLGTCEKYPVADPVTNGLRSSFGKPRD